MTEGGKFQNSYDQSGPFPPRDHLERDAKGPNDWLLWAFRRHVPPSDYLIENAAAKNIFPNGIIGEILKIALSDRRLGWEEVDTLMMQLHCEEGAGSEVLSAMVSAKRTGRGGGSKQRKRSAAWKGKVDAYVENLRSTDPTLFDGKKKYVLARIIRWVRENDITDRKDSTVRDHVYKTLK